MSSIASCTYANSDEKKTYISTTDFRYDFYKYAVTFSDKTFVNSGALTLIDGASSTKCPANRILHENGKKLRPDIDPMNSFDLNGNLIVPKFLIGVYDPISFLTGFIDPTSSAFAIYDTNYSVGELDGKKNGLIYNADGQGSKLNVGPTSGLVITPTNASVQTVQAGNSCIGSVRFTGNTSVIVQTTAYTNSSLVFLTNVNNAGSAQIAYQGVSTGIFQINTNSAAGLTINWMVVN